ncbi:hypothetical protein, partial [Neisseria sicca]|uniref:hypothetical protein n=1 Tax=Neisseria sicca TaxID=490 RepID=UPI0011BD0F81
MEDGTGRDELKFLVGFGRGFEQVDSFEDVLLEGLRDVGMRVVVVDEGDVIEDVLVIGIDK